MTIKATWIGRRFYRIPSAWTVFRAEGHLWYRVRDGWRARR